jgi:hypothetical protein
MKRVFAITGLMLVFGLFFGCGAQADQTEPAFWDYWGDGKAELSGYDLTFTRYGEPRKGTAVSIFVTETFSKADRVKAEKNQIPEADQLPVFKLNLVKDFPTGIYDYNLMASVFTSIPAFQNRRPGSPVKIAFSSQEWCGNVYEELKFFEDKIIRDTNSYFYGETAKGVHDPYPTGGITEDELPFVVRTLVDPFAAPGEKKTVPFLPSSERFRLTHKKHEWTEATIERGAGDSTITTPAGKFAVEIWAITLKDGLTIKYFVEKAYPRRIVKWETSTGETALLKGSARLTYWKLNGPDGAKYLKEFGLR